MHLNSRLIFERYARPYFRAGSHVLELGPDARPSTYQQAVGDPAVTWDTADLTGSATPHGDRLFGAGRTDDLTHVMDDAYSVPTPDNSFDIVLSGQVIEHVRQIWRWMPELARVCKPGGYVITIGPVSWPYHEAPVDCWRAHPDGLSALCEAAGLRVVQAVSASLEPRPSRRPYPGASFGPSGGAKGIVKRVVGLVGWPLPIAVDAVAIARKPLPADVAP
jgi:SAM-dependent methyltransferase